MRSCCLRHGAERRTRRESADGAPTGLAPSSASRSNSARILGLKRTPQRMASAVRRLCMSARAGEASRWPARWWSAARRCALRETWPSHGHAERVDNDVAPCGAPSPLAFRFSGEAFCETHARRRDERIARGYLKIESEVKLGARQKKSVITGLDPVIHV